MAKKSKKVKEEVTQPVPDQWQELVYFPTSVYILEKPSFLDIVKTVSEENIDIVKKDHTLNDIYPVYMSGTYVDDPRIKDFVQYVGQTAWNIMNHQGYAMDNFALQFSEM